jgi:hypothetical protein
MYPLKKMDLNFSTALKRAERALVSFCIHGLQGGTIRILNHKAHSSIFVRKMTALGLVGAVHGKTRH